MVVELQQAMRKRVGSREWLDEETRQRAIEKVTHNQTHSNIKINTHISIIYLNLKLICTQITIVKVQHTCHTIKIPIQALYM